jgi:hypothetical protein
MRTSRLISVGVVLTVAGALAVATTAFGQDGPKPPKVTTKGDHGQPGIEVLPSASAAPVTWLPEVPGESFTGIPGARRVKPEKDKEARVLTLTDGQTGQQYQVPYTAAIEAEQTPDGLLHGRAKVPDGAEMDAALRAALPPDVYEKLQASKAAKKPPG